MSEIKNWEQIDADMQRGYSYAGANEYDSVAACNEWGKVWSAVVSVMQSNNYKYIDDFDDVFSGMQCIFNWASDYEMELGNAVHEDVSFAKTRIDFCTEYLKYVPDRDELNSLNMRRAIAESYFRMGMEDVGEKEFIRLTSENPTWGWGWIGWADEYSDFSKNRNPGKVIEILSKALKIDGVDEKPEIKSRLRETYEKCGMHKEASSIVIEDRDFGIPLSEIGNFARSAKLTMEEILREPVRKVKIGRNEQCPCGSGKKYKRCCGRNY